MSGPARFGLECPAMECFVGIDAGGSGSRWAVLDTAGEWVCGDDGPPIQVTEFGVPETVSRVAALLTRLASRIPSVEHATTVVGLAGGDDEDLRRSIALGVSQACDPEPGASRAATEIHVVGDTVTGAAAALWDGPGVALFAGTGSFAMARSGGGELLRVGGRGNRISDHGSGYRVVRAAAEAVYLASEGIGPATELWDPICQAMRVSHPLDLGLAFVHRAAAEVARCFKVVVATAEAGDVVAVDVLRSSATSFARLAKAAIARAELPGDARIVLGGGTQNSVFYRRMVTEALAEEGCRGVVEVLSTPPAQGAALLARAVAHRESPLASWVDG